MKRYYIFMVFLLILACSRPTLKILGIMDRDSMKLTVVNRNDFLLTAVTISLNGTYVYTTQSITAGERYTIILGDLLDGDGVSFSLKRSEYTTLTVEADQGYYKAAWKK